MNLKAKTIEAEHKKAAELRLAARRAFLKEKGLDAATIQKDVLIRKIGAEIRKAKRRLVRTAAQEKLSADLAQAKAEKAAAKKAAPVSAAAPSPKKAGGPDKAKKEKKARQKKQPE